MTVVKACENQTEWDDFIHAHNGHPLQLWGWGAIKSAHNWHALRLFVYDDDHVIGAAQLLVRQLPQPFNAVVYAPRGPVASPEHRSTVLAALARHASDNYRAVSLTIEPDWEEEVGEPGWRRTSNTILIPRTLVLDVTQSDEQLMAAMAKKTRQYIRKSQNEAIEIRPVVSREELAGCLELYKQTSSRAGFAVHDDQYYYDIFDLLDDNSPVYAAFSHGQPVAFLWLATSQAVAFELYGGMNDLGQQLRANYALKWHVILAMKQRGIVRYDFNGLLNDGVSTFKQGFARHETMLAGTYDYALSPLYIVWDIGLPFAKKVIRKLKSLR